MKICIQGGRLIDPANGIDAVNDIYIAAGRVVGIGQALQVGIAVQHDAVAVLVERAVVGGAFRDGGAGLAADCVRRGDFIGAGVREMFHGRAFQAVDGVPGGVGAHHRELVRPGIALVGDAPGRVDLDRAQGVVGRPPGAQHQQAEQQHGHETGQAVFHWMAPPSADRDTVKQAPSRPWAARIRSQHSRTAPAPPFRVLVQWAA